MRDSTLWQLHWQYENGTTEMKAQREIHSYDEMRAFVEEIRKAHPLSPEAKWPRWMACNGESEHLARWEIRMEAPNGPSGPPKPFENADIMLLNDLSDQSYITRMPNPEEITLERTGTQ